LDKNGRALSMILRRRREIRESGPSEYIRTSYKIEREFARKIFETHGLALAVEYLLGRAIDPNRIV